jgi:lipopolysaccharide/colanic/teichoic acid biosynthesis glycosyltransferase/GGDEF domain-containing protein
MIYPQHHFLDRLREERSRSDRTRRPFTLVLFPLDGAAATQAKGANGGLERTLKALARTTRRSDLWGLYGRDRLGLLLPDTAEPAARYVVSRLTALLSAAPKPRAPALALSPAACSIVEYPRALERTLGGQAADRPGQTATDSPRRVRRPEPPAKGRAEFDLLEKTGLSPLQRANGLTARLYRLEKRCLDVAGALVGLLLTAVVALPIALAIKATTQGPVLFKQTRLGRNGRHFTFLKFRTMYHNCDQTVHKEYVTRLIQESAEKHEKNGAAFYKLADDPRITPVGNFLRKTSLDELPQFLNVLRGEMSLVGPRPPIPYEVERYEPWEIRRILEAKPGITGLWQVSGRSTLTFAENVRLDLRYIENQSLWQDVKILLKTIKVIFISEGAC